MRNEPLIEQISGLDDGPEYLALVTIADVDDKRKAYPMRNDGGLKITCTTQVSPVKLADPIILADYTTENLVCDANYIKAFSVQLKDSTSEEDARRLWDAKLTFEVDGELLFKKAPLKEILQKKEILIPEPSPGKSCLFTAHPVELPYRPDSKADKKTWLGYILPNGTHIRILLEGIPEGVGKVFIETSFKLVRYTTKGIAAGK